MQFCKNYFLFREGKKIAENNESADKSLLKFQAIHIGQCCRKRNGF